MSKRERQTLSALGQTGSPLRTYKRRKKHVPIKDEFALDRLFAEEVPGRAGPHAAVGVQSADSDREDKENMDPGPWARRSAATPQGKQCKQPGLLRAAGGVRTPLADTTELVNAQTNQRSGGHPSWGLGSEAAFFAELDDDALAEESERSQTKSPKSPRPCLGLCSIESQPTELLPRIYPDLKAE